jgi:WD40 repeat protein
MHPHSSKKLTLLCSLFVLAAIGSTAQTDVPIKSVKGHVKEVTSLIFSNNNKYLISGGTDGAVRIWSNPELQEIHSLEEHYSLSAVAIDGNDRVISGSSDDDTGYLWNYVSGERQFRFAVTTKEGSDKLYTDGISIYDVAFSADGSKIFTCGGKVLGGRHEVRIYDASTGKFINSYDLHGTLILSMDVHPNGKWIVTSSASSDGDGSVILSDWESGKIVRTFGSNFGDVTTVIFNKDGSLVASTADRNVTIWETASGKKLQTFTGHTDRVTSLAFTPDGKFIVSGGRDKKVNIWSLEQGELSKSINCGVAVHSVAVSADGKTIGAGYENGTVNLFPFELSSNKRTAAVTTNALEILPRVRKVSSAPFANLKEMPELVIETGVHNDIVQNIRYTKDGKEIVTASWDKTIRIWDSGNGRLVRTIYVPQYAGVEGQIYAMDVSPDKKYIAVAGSSIGQKYDKKTEKYIGDYVLLIDYKTGKILDVATDHKQSIFGVSFSPDGKKLASCAGVLDNKVNIYSIDAVQNKLALQESFVMTVTAKKFFPECESVFGDVCEHTVLSVKFSPDSKDVYAIDAHGMLVRYTLQSGSSGKLIGESAARKNAAITGKITPKASFRSMAVDPKGRYVAVGDVSGKVLIVDAKGKDIAADAHESAEMLLVTIPLQKNAIVMSLDFDATGTKLAVSIGNEVRVYEILIDQLTPPASVTTPILSFKDHKKGVSYAVFSNDGSTVASNGGDFNSSMLWDAKTGKVKFGLGGDKTNSKVTRVGVHKQNPFLIGIGNELFDNGYKNHFGTITKAFDLKNLRVVDVAVDSSYATAESQVSESGASAPDFQSIFDEQMFSYLPLKNGAVVIGTENALFLDNATNLLTMTGARTYGMASAADGETFYIGQSDGRILIYDTQTMQMIATLYVATQNEWILFTPDGYYTSSRHGAKLVGWLVNESVRTTPKFYPFEQFDLRLNRPDIVLSRIGGFPKNRIDLLYKAYQKRLQKMGVEEKMLSDQLVAPVMQLDIQVSETTQKQFTFNVKASDSQNDLERLNVYINDVPFYGSRGLSLKATPSKTLDKQVTVELNNGQNKIQVSVLNMSGIESFQETRYVNYRGAAVTPNLFILAIGVSAYDDQSFNLQYAAKDAKDISTLYQGQVGKFGNVKTMVILDKEATVEKIKAAKIFLKESRPDDEVILFAAGHGLLDNNLDFYFATTDVDFNNPSIRGLKYDDLEGLLDQIASRKKLMLIDACHSGEIDKDAVVATEGPVNTTIQTTGVKSRGFKNLTNNDLGVTDVYELMRMMFADLRKGSGAMVISSASGAEFAFENDVWKNGVFTYSLLEGLKTGNANLNKDTDVQVSELRDYVIKRVGELTNGKQTPTSRKENLEFDFKIW